MITVAKPGLMITHLGREQEVFAFSGFEFKKNPNIPARNFLPEGENCIPLVGHDLNNNLKLYENQEPVAPADKTRIFKEPITIIYDGRKNV